jgi:hypothetical protein
MITLINPFPKKKGKLGWRKNLSISRIEFLIITTQLDKTQKKEIPFLIEEATETTRTKISFFILKIMTGSVI